MANTGYRKGNVVEVKVTESLSSGLKVKLTEYGIQGFVPRKEISWERSLRVPLEPPQIGEKHKALILDAKGKILRLSLRQVTDPWRDVIKRQSYQEGNIIIGEVVNVRHNAAYVQLKPGIEAIIYPRDASFIKKNIEDVLWVGDKIRAKIISCDLPRHHIEASIVQALQERVVNPKEALLKKFEYTSLLREKIGQTEEKLPFLDEQGKKITMSSNPKPIKHALIVDDDEDWLKFLEKQIEEHYTACVDTVKNSDDGWEKIEEGNIYDIVIIDVQLGREDGRSFAEEIKDKYADFPILLISNAPQDLTNLREKYNGVSFAVKTEDLGTIFNAIDQIRLGRSSLTRTLALAMTSEQQINEFTSAVALSKNRITEILKWLYKEVSPDYCLLIATEPEKQEISIIDSFPSLSDIEKKGAQDGLFYSPASRIIEEERSIQQNDIDCQNDRRYRNFFPTLYFRSFFGIPVHLPGGRSRYALIVLNEEPGGFLNQDVVQQTYNAGNFLSLVLEKLSMLDTMQRYQYTHAMGMLLGDFVHEINHRLQTLENAQKELSGVVSDSLDWQNKNSRELWMKELSDASADIEYANKNLKALTKAYAQQINFEYEAVDINSLLEDVVQRLAAETKTKTMVTIYKKLDTALPKPKSIQENLKQVFTNLLLNAVQLINHQQDILDMARKRTSRPLSRKNGVIFIQTLYNAGSDYPIEVRIIDNGPGIHWREQRRIFEPHFSRRGGAGLGLYISQNIINRVGGRLTLLDSILFEGSVFSVKLPVTEEEKTHVENSIA